MNPRRALVLSALASAAGRSRGTEPDPVRRGRPMRFPRDHGAHVETRSEWWYATGWIGEADAPTQGFQLTFFRIRTGLADTLPGRLAPRQILFAHAALSDLRQRQHRHDQRLQRWNSVADRQARAGAARDDASVWIGSWWLSREADGWRAAVTSSQDRGWGMDLRLTPTQPPLLQGDQGFSRKGPLEAQASHYYSLPQLDLGGSLRLGGASVAARGRAWLDHEWSDEILATDAVGWDWIGFNLFDGGALTAFQLRRRDGSALWAGGSHRSGAGALTIFGADAVRWTPGRRWRSPVTGADYPLAWQVVTPAGAFAVRALLDAQELDSRQGTGTLYWEGLSELLDGGGRRIGLGYLELTGYAGTLRL